MFHYPELNRQVRTRMESEQGISFTEFTYQLLQGYDFVHLCRWGREMHGCRTIDMQRWPYNAGL